MSGITGASRGAVWEERYQELAVELDDLWRQLLTDIVKKAAIKATPAEFDKFVDRVANSIEVFRASTSMQQATHRRDSRCAAQALFQGTRGHLRS